MKLILPVLLALITSSAQAQGSPQKDPPWKGWLGCYTTRSWNGIEIDPLAGGNLGQIWEGEGWAVTEPNGNPLHTINLVLVQQFPAQNIRVMGDQFALADKGEWSYTSEGLDYQFWGEVKLHDTVGYVKVHLTLNEDAFHVVTIHATREYPGSTAAPTDETYVLEHRDCSRR